MISLLRCACCVLGVVSLDVFVVNPGEHCFRQVCQEIPSNLEGIEDRPILISALVDESLLELIGELKDQFISFGESLFADDGSQAAQIIALCIVSLELI